jgi:hypothetical protein
VACDYSSLKEVFKQKHALEQKQQLAKELMSASPARRKQEVSPDLFDLKILPNPKSVRNYLRNFMTENQVVVIAYSQERFAISAGVLGNSGDPDCILFIDGRLQMPEMWLCCRDAQTLYHAMNADLQTLLISCAEHCVSVHLRAQIDYGFFEEYFV